MKISNDTVAILKNFSTINQGILFKPGKVVKTISSQKTVLAEATIGEDFPSQFGIYDLNCFLSIHSLHKDEPSVDFNGNDAVISDSKGRSKFTYRGCASNLITVPPENGLNMPTAEVKFELKVEDLQWILSSASVIASTHIAFESDGKKINLVAFNAADDAAHKNYLQVGDGNGEVYNVIFKTENFKMVVDTYEVSISSKGFANFKSKNKQLQYWITTETGSSFKKK